jgi:hypothetical protein
MASSLHLAQEHTRNIRSRSASRTTAGVQDRGVRDGIPEGTVDALAGVPR